MTQATVIGTTVVEVMAEPAAREDPKATEVNARHGDEHGSLSKQRAGAAKRPTTQQELDRELGRPLIAPPDCWRSSSKVLRPILPRVTSEQAIDLIAAATALSGAYWQTATPAPARKGLYLGADHRLAHAMVDAQGRVSRTLNAMFEGFFTSVAVDDSFHPHLWRS